MSDYRFQIVEHNDIMCLHVMIDAEPIAECHIPLEDIQTAKDREIVETIRELKAILQPQTKT